jgi:hypothetical protein
MSTGASRASVAIASYKRYLRARLKANREALADDTGTANHQGQDDAPPVLDESRRTIPPRGNAQAEPRKAS